MLLPTDDGRGRLHWLMSLVRSLILKPAPSTCTVLNMPDQHQTLDVTSRKKTKKKTPLCEPCHLPTESSHFREWITYPTFADVQWHQRLTNWVTSHCSEYTDQPYHYDHLILTRSPLPPEPWPIKAWTPLDLWRCDIWHQAISSRSLQSCKSHCLLQLIFVLPGAIASPG